MMIPLRFSDKTQRAAISEWSFCHKKILFFTRSGIASARNIRRLVIGGIIPNTAVYLQGEQGHTEPPKTVAASSPLLNTKGPMRTPKLRTGNHAHSPSSLTSQKLAYFSFLCY